MDTLKFFSGIEVLNHYKTTAQLSMSTYTLNRLGIFYTGNFLENYLEKIDISYTVFKYFLYTYKNVLLKYGIYSVSITYNKILRFLLMYNEFFRYIRLSLFSGKFIIDLSNCNTDKRTLYLITSKFFGVLSLSDNNSFNTCMYASSYGYTGIVKLLLDIGGVDNLNKCMMIASIHNHINVVELLIERGADNLNGCVIIAAGNNCIDVVKLLIKRGADDLNECMRIASENNSVDVVKFLLERNLN